MTHEPSSPYRGRAEQSSAVFNAREAAEYLAVHIETLYRLVRARALPHTRVNRALQFRRKDVEDYLQEQTARYWQQVDGRGRTRKEKQEATAPREIEEREDCLHIQ
jgi:excisionase family DNA binding protein